MLDRTRSDFKVILPSDREIILMRTFEAPRRLVFEVLTRPEHLRNWYGCSEAKLIACDIDLRVGGKYRYVMRTGDGVHHTTCGVYREIAAPARVIYTEQHVTATFASKAAVVTLTLAEEQGRTRYRAVALYQSKAGRDEALAFGVEEGARAALDKVGDLVAAIAADAAEPAT